MTSTRGGSRVAASRASSALIDERMGAYIQRLLDCDPTEARRVQKAHFHEHGTTLAGLMNSFMISVSLGLQYGVPLEVYVAKFSHMRFEPSGMTNDADIRIAKSIVDYIFRWMGKKFLTSEQQEEAGILTAEVKARLAAAKDQEKVKDAIAAA